MDDIKFWNKITKVVYSRIHSEDNNLNIEVKDSTKEVNFYTNQITFHDHGGTQLGYIDSSGVIRGLTVDGHATDLDITTLETDLSSNTSRIIVLETDASSNTSRIETLETNLTDNTSRIVVLETDLTDNTSRIETLETDVTSNTSRIEGLETNM